MVRLVPSLPRTSSFLEPSSPDELTPGTIDLSKVTKLQDVVFRCLSGSLSSGWVIMMLETITSGHRDLRQISIHIPYAPDYNRDLRLIEQVSAAKPGMRWSDLDRLLVQLWESHSIKSKVVCPRSRNRTMRVEDWTKYLLPGIADRGIVELIE